MGSKQSRKKKVELAAALSELEKVEDPNPSVAKRVREFVDGMKKFVR